MLLDNQLLGSLTNSSPSTMVQDHAILGGHMLGDVECACARDISCTLAWPLQLAAWPGRLELRPPHAQIMRASRHQNRSAQLWVLPHCSESQLTHCDRRNGSWPPLPLPCTPHTYIQAHSAYRGPPHTCNAKHVTDMVAHHYMCTPAATWSTVILQLLTLRLRQSKGNPSPQIQLTLEARQLLNIEIPLHPPSLPAADV
jgi:hypothetical protein